ncbi:MAG: calcium/sodium antiporter [Candidatus Woesearchaeota archaeon]
MIMYILLVLGIFLLIKGADFLVDSASALSQKFYISPFFIGLTIVALGTSLPEFMVAIFSSLQQQSDIILGNVIGSNIANMFFVLGVSGLFSVLSMQQARHDMILSFYATVLTLILALFFPTYTYILFFVFLLYVYSITQRKKIDVPQEPAHMSTLKMYGYFFIGLGMLLLGGHLTIDSVISIATQWHISTYVLSFFLIALGTSLPELVTFLVAIKKKQYHMGIGNIVGSNIFNILFVLGFSGFLTTFTYSFFHIIDIVCIACITLLLYTQQHLHRIHGVVLVTLYVLYMLFIFLR